MTTDGDGGHGGDDGNGGDDGGREFEPDPERVRLLRAVADDIRGDSSERNQLAAIVHRVSDLYDPDEETTPEEIYRSARFISQVKDRGGLER